MVGLMEGPTNDQLGSCARVLTFKIVAQVKCEEYGDVSRPRKTHATFKEVINKKSMNLFFFSAKKEA